MKLNFNCCISVKYEYVYFFYIYIINGIVDVKLCIYGIYNV